MAEITAATVKALREKTGLGMMECKKALTAAGGDMNKAIEELRKRGELKSEKKGERETAEGIIGSYIHLQGKIGVLIEVNCETDFVARNDNFKEFVKDVSMHIAASDPKYVTPAEVPADRIEKEREIFAAQVKDKPANVIDKIVDGKVNKWLSEICLIKQPFVRDNDVTIEALTKQKIAEIGENIVIRRFVRYAVGEEIEGEVKKEAGAEASAAKEEALSKKFAEKKTASASVKKDTAASAAKKTAPSAKKTGTSAAKSATGGAKKASTAKKTASSSGAKKKK